MIRKDEIAIGGLVIDVIRKSNLKNLYIKIKPPKGDVCISSPVEANEEDIRLFVLNKLPEINKIRDKMLSQERQSKREYVSGESLYLWGKLYRLQVVYEGKKHQVIKTPSKIIMYVSKGTSKENREKLLIEWYRQELNKVLLDIIKKYSKKMGVQVNEFRIKNMKTRWGTCNIDKRRIWINLQLIKKPIECLEYVVVHELVHLIEKNHTFKFQFLVEHYFPSWKEVKNLLSSLPLDYFESGDK